MQSKPNQTVENKSASRAVTVPILIFLLAISYVTCWAICSSSWVFSQWSNLKMDEIVYELNAPLTGTGSNMVQDYVLKCVVPGFVVVAAELILILPRRKRVSRRVCRNVATVTAIAGAGVFLWFGFRVDFFDYVRNSHTDSDFIEEHYADPAETKLTFPEQKRNLIHIYLESMETTYADQESGGGFDFNCIPELTELAKENEDFSGNGTWTEEDNDSKNKETNLSAGQNKNDIINGGHALPGNTWTMGAMFGMSTGLPLKAGDNEEMASMDSFFPGMTAIGDILEEEGYHQVLAIGSDATFGGRRQFYTDHGNYEIQDYVYAKENGLIPEDYYVWWGFEDEKLFSFAKESLTTLANEGEPFNYTMLTVDTHFSDGYVCDLCQDEFGDNQYANVMACSSRQVTEFIKWCQQQDWYENTTIVLTGDHPTMDADFCEDVDASYVRKTYTCYINSAVQPSDSSLRRTYTTLDHFPTILASLGVSIEGERLGLGTNLFSDTKTLSEVYGYSHVSEEVSKNSSFLSSLEEMDDSVYSPEETFAKLDAPKASVTVENPNPGEDGNANSGGEVTATFTTESLRNFSWNILGVRVRIWYENGENTVARWIDLGKLSDGSWSGTFRIGSDWFGDAEEIHYAAYVNCEEESDDSDNGQAAEQEEPKQTGFINLGKEGTFQLSKQ